MTPADVVRRGAGYLGRHEVESPLATAEALMQLVLGTDRTAVYARSAGLTTAEAKAYGRALCRRCTGVPLQHLTREQGFRRLVLGVRPGVFVPRPETEVVVERALGALAELETPAVVDVGTGTGAIALSIAYERPDARVWATDLSADAVTLARLNAERLELAVTVLEGNLLEPLPEDLRGRLDLVVSNPPYLAVGTELPVEVRADPPQGVFGDPGLYDRLLAQAFAALRPGGSVVVEIEESAGERVADAAVRAGFLDTEVTPDLAGRQRVLSARRP